MREYIIAYNNSWIHFFIKPHVGLCSRKKSGLKFDDYKVLVHGASADFCVYSVDDYIHIVCQDEKGSVLYLMFNGTTWKRNILLESRTAKPYVKNFVIIDISGHIGILYTIENKDRIMLVHQLLIGNASPTVVDYIKSDSAPFCVYKHHETDFSVFYTNEKGVSCEIIYKWSQKQFNEPKILSDFHNIKFVHEKDNIVSLAAIKTTNNAKNLIYIKRTPDGNETESDVYLNCSDNIMPIISNYGKKKFMVWTEHGNVITSCMDENEKWSRPIQYAKSSKTEIKLYSICYNGNYEHYYGVALEHDFILYGTHDVLKRPPKTAKYNHSDFNVSVSKDSQNLLITHGKQIKQLYDELSLQRNKLAELSARIEDLLSSVPIADEEDIDNVLLN